MSVHKTPQELFAVALLAVAVGAWSLGCSDDSASGPGDSASLGETSSTESSDDPEAGEGEGESPGATEEGSPEGAEGEEGEGEEGEGEEGEGEEGEGEGEEGEGEEGEEGEGEEGDPGDECLTAEERFVATLWEPVLSQKCLPCHNAEGYAAYSSMVLMYEDDGPDWLQHNRDTFDALALEQLDGTSLVLLKPTGQHPAGHGGGLVLEEGSAQLEILAHYVAWLEGDVDDCEPGVAAACEQDIPGPRLLRRLTHTAYDHTIVDLLGVESTFGRDFAADDVIGGFANNAGALKVSKLLAEQYRSAAEAIAEQAVTYQLESMLPCDPVETGQALCAATFIRDFGRRAFRRPMTEEDVAAYFGLWNAIAVEDGFEMGIQWVLTAMLQSPHFLYRAEIGVLGDDGAFALTDFEIAAELSYSVWDTMPDEALLVRAEAGDLHTPEAIQEELTRMLADPRAERFIKGFVGEWLHIDRLHTVPKVMQVYPKLTFPMRDQMIGQTERLAAQIAADGGGLADLLLSDTTYATDELAAYMGIPAGEGEADAEGYREVSIAGSPYGGVLSHPSVTTTFAGPDASSPVKRGVLIRERLLCQELAPPPPGLDITPPTPDPDLPTAEQFAIHSSDATCKGCHERIDPIGFSFENYDGSGVWREFEGTNWIDPNGEIVKVPGSSTHGTYYGVEGLAELLAESSEVDACYAELALAYTTGLYENDATDCAAEAILEAKSGESIGLLEPLERLTAYVHFRSRLGELGESNGPASGPLADDLSEYGDFSDELYPSLGSGGGSSVPGIIDGVTLTLTTQSSWNAGYCSDGVVENTTDDTVIWVVAAEIEGTINNLWNANKTEEGGLTIFTGVGWNSEIGPGETAPFGFCAEY